MNFNFELGYAWVWRFLIMWKFFDEKPSVSFYKSDMETEIFCMKLTFKNIILILNAILFFFFVIVALYGEFIR